MQNGRKFSFTTTFIQEFMASDKLDRKNDIVFV